MNSCQNDFLVSFCCKCMNLIHYMRDLTASDTTSCIRNDTVSTELITAVLNFDICAYMLCCMINCQFFIFFCLVDLEHMFLSDVLLLIFLEYLDNISLLIVSKDQVYSLIFIQFPFICLYITSGCDHDSIRVHFLCFVQHLSGFTVCNVGYCTGIN